MRVQLIKAAGESWSKHTTSNQDNAASAQAEAGLVESPGYIIMNLMEHDASKPYHLPSCVGGNSIYSAQGYNIMTRYVGYTIGHDKPMHRDVWWGTDALKSSLTLSLRAITYCSTVWCNGKDTEILYEWILYAREWDIQYCLPFAPGTTVKYVAVES